MNEEFFTKIVSSGDREVVKCLEDERADGGVAIMVLYSFLLVSESGHVARLNTPNSEHGLIVRIAHTYSRIQERSQGR